jgi:hypothetical protein
MRLSWANKSIRKLAVKFLTSAVRINCTMKSSFYNPTNGEIVEAISYIQYTSAVHGMINSR